MAQVKGGIRWMELRNSGSWSIYQQATWAPDANERWLSGICYDSGQYRPGVMFPAPRPTRRSVYGPQCLRSLEQ